MIRFYLVFGFILFYTSILAQPCVQVLNRDIPDNGRFYTARIEANTSTSGARILCGVRLSFSHQFVNELRFVLQSPSGKRLPLIAGKTGSSKTKGSFFDVYFVRGDETAHPDDFKKPIWQENKWEENTAYVGSYYPDGENGLAHFDGDQMTGTWNLIYADQVSGGTGRLESFELIFCESPSFCNPCSVPRDFVSNQNFGSFCSGDPQLAQINPSFITSNLQSGYENTFLVVNQRNTIVARGPNPDFTTLPKGNYTIVGVQFRAANASIVEGINNINTLNDRFYGNQATICGAISNGSGKITILSNPEYQDQVLEIYGRNFVVLNGETITTDQIVNQEYIDINGCDSLVRTDVQFKEYTPTFAQNHQYNCDNTSITISVSTAQNFEVQRWFTRDGKISNQSNISSSEIIVNSPGTYFVVFQIQDYLDTVSYDLDIDPASPVITLSNEYAMCSSNPLSLTIGSNFDQATVTPAQTATIDGKTLTITEPNLYTVVVTNEACTISKSILVKPPEVGEAISIDDAVISCPGTQADLVPDLDREYEQYSWYRDGEEVATSRTLSTAIPGIYTFRAYDGNSCGSTGIAQVTDISASINLLIEGPDLINCTNQHKDNRLTAQFEGEFDIEWTLPDGSQRTEQSIPITSDGTYTVSISDGSGCVISESKTITTDLTELDFEDPDKVTIECEDPFAWITVDIGATQDDYSITWQGASSGDPQTNAIVTTPGSVRITVTHVTSQCKTEKTITVDEEPGKPVLADISNYPTAFTCENSAPKIPLSIMDCADCEISLISTDKFELINDTLIAQNPGIAYLDLKQGSCVREVEINFPDQREAKKLSVEARNIGCSDTHGSIRIANESDYSSIEFFDGTDTIPYTANEFRNILQPVKYTVIYEDKNNGCTGQEEIEITRAEGAPEINYEQIQFLDCISGIATLRIHGSGINRVVWEDPSGMTLGSTGNTIEVQKAGRYEFTVFNQNNCFISGQFDVRDDRSDPTVQLNEEYVVPCSSQDGLAKIVLDSTGLNSVAWYGPGGLVSEVFNPELGPGNYQVILEGKNGCKSTEETSVVRQAAGAGPEIIAPPITCNQAFSTVHLSSYDEVAEVQWIDESGQASVSDSFEVYNPGHISLVIKQQNGCLISLRQTVSEDKNTVPFTINQPIINCHNLQPTFRTQVPDSVTRSIDYQWFFQDIPVGNDASYDIQYPGIYRVEARFDNGCVDSAMHEVRLDTVAVDWELKTDTITCARSKIQLSSDIPVGHIETASWSGPDDFTSNAKRPNFQMPGTYTVTYAGENGCQASTSMKIFDDQHAPLLDSVGFLSLGCDGKEVDLTYFTRDSVTTRYWHLPGGQILEDSIVQINAKGDYLLYLEGDNGCSKIDTFFIDKTVTPKFELEVQAAGCDDHIGKATVFPGLDTFETIWYEPGSMTELGRGHESPQLSVGSYLVTVINPYNNCDTTTVLEVVDISSVMEVELAIDDSLRCERSEANLIASVYPPSEDYIYEWKYQSGGDPISTDTVAVGISREGNYSFQARDTVNQCVVEGTYRNVRAPSRLRNFSLFLTEPACNINRTGFAIIDSVIGASDMSQMTYSLDNAPYRQQDTFPFLYANERYHISAKDQYGCTLDTILFPQLRGIMDRVSPIADTTINSGDSINFNTPYFQIDYISSDSPLSEKYTWILNPDTLSCDFDCVEPIQQRFYETRNVTAIMTNEYGCTITDTFRIYVREGDVLNLPNAIAPASSTVGNAHACIYTNQYIQNIETYLIFNRRGNVIYKQANFSPIDPHQHLEFCWDGRDQQGNIHPPGTYNYYVKYRTVYGEIKEKYGNILLIR